MAANVVVDADALVTADVTVVTVTVTVTVTTRLRMSTSTSQTELLEGHGGFGFVKGSAMLGHGMVCHWYVTYRLERWGVKPSQIKSSKFEVDAI